MADGEDNYGAEIATQQPHWSIRTKTPFKGLAASTASFDQHLFKPNAIQLLSQSSSIQQLFGDYFPYNCFTTQK